MSDRQWLLAGLWIAAICGGAHAKEFPADLAQAKPGTVIELPEGTFAGGFEVPEGVTLRGAGYGKTIIEARGAAVGIAVKARSVRIEDLTVLSSGTGIGLVSAEKTTISRVMVLGGSIGIQASGAAEARIENAIVSKAPIGISLNRCTRSAVVNCTVVAADACGLSASVCRDTAIFNNLVADAGTGVVLGGADAQRNLAVDYNLYQALSVGKVDGQLQRPSIPTWRDVSGGMDAHSVSLGVTFANPARNDFHPVSTLSWNPARATTSDWGVAELAGHKAPATDLDGLPRIGAVDVGALEAPELPGPRADGQFQIASDEGSKSAGLFGAENRLVAYLFQGLPLKQGTHRFVLPARDLFGRPIPPGSYEVRIVESTVDWIYRGMTCNSGADNSPENAESVHATRLAYAPDGRLLTAYGWSERRINLRLSDPATNKAQWAFEGSADNAGLCLDAAGHVLLLRAGAEGSHDLYQIDAATGSPMPRRDGTLYANIKHKFKSQWLGGVAELGGRLFVTDPDAGQLLLGTPDRLEFDTAVPLAKPSCPVADRKRNLVWLVSAGEKLVALNADGKLVLEFAGIAGPLALSVAGDRMAVASAATGKIHVLDIRDPAKPVPVRTIGRGDGPFGAWLPDRFHFQSYPLNPKNAGVSLALSETGCIAVRDSSGRVVTFTADGRPLYSGFAQWGGDPIFAQFAGDKQLRAFDTSAAVSYFLDPQTGGWTPDTYWGLPPMERSSLRGFFSAGGRHFGVFTFQGPDKRGESVLIACYDRPAVRAVIRYDADAAGGYLVRRDTNGDGVIDDRDQPATPLVGTDGKPVRERLSGRFMFVHPDGTIYHSGHQVLLRWKPKGLDGQGVPMHEFGEERIFTAKDPTVPSPYFLDKTEDLRCASTARPAPDGGVGAAINLRHTPKGMGLSNSGATDLARWNPDGQLRWLRTVNDFSPIQGIEPLPGVTLSSWGHQAEYMALDDDGLELGRFGFPAAVNWSGFWVDHPQEWSAVRGGDGNVEVIIGDYMQNCHHWMTVRKIGAVKKSRIAVALSPERARESAYRAPALHEPLGQARAPEIVIKKLPGPLAIDGNLEKWRRLNFPPQILLTPQNSSGGIGGPDDLSGVIRLGYHGRDLYGMAVVFDDVVSFHQPASRFYKADSLQFCVNGFLPGFGFNLAQTTDHGAMFFRNRFFFNKMDLYLDPAKAPRILQRFDNAQKIPERRYIESMYGVDLSASPGYVIEFKLPLDDSSYQGDEKIVPEVQSGKWFWLGFMLNDNDRPGTDNQSFISWPGTFGVFNPPESGAKARFE